MVLYSCNSGHVVVDNYDETIADTEKELMSEVWDVIPSEDADVDDWSGEPWDFYGPSSRPSLF